MGTWSTGRREALVRRPSSLTEYYFPDLGFGAPLRSTTFEPRKNAWPGPPPPDRKCEFPRRVLRFNDIIIRISASMQKVSEI